jgi:hypothetical protein
MKKAIILLIISLMLSGCKTINDSLVYTTNNESKNLIDEAEKLILDYKFNGNSENIKKAKVVIKKLSDSAENNNYLEAIVFGLYGEADLAQKLTANINLYISEIKRRNSREEKLYILQAEMEANQSKRETIIGAGIKNSVNSNRLKIMQAINYFSGGRYKDAVVLFDEGLVNLPDFYSGYYKKYRDLAFQFNENKPNSLDSIKIILKNEITVQDMLKLILSETKLFAGIIKNEKQPLGELYDNLKSEDFFYFLTKLDLNDAVKRKDVAYFLIHLVGYLENDPSLAVKYHVGEEEYAKSLLPDVKSNEYYYSACLVLAEREIMELPDGSSFYPNIGVSGLKFYEMIKKLNDTYRK